MGVLVDIFDSPGTDQFQVVKEPLENSQIAKVRLDELHLVVDYDDLYLLCCVA